MLYVNIGVISLDIYINSHIHVFIVYTYKLGDTEHLAQWADRTNVHNGG